MKTIHILATLTLLVMAQVACNLVMQRPVVRTIPIETPIAAAESTGIPALPLPTQPPLPTEIPALLPTQTPLPLYQTVTLGGSAVEESGKAPDYTFKAITPVLQSSSDPRVENFNQLVAARVQQAVGPFKQDLANQPATPISAGSYFSLTYALISPPGNLISLQLHIEGYTDGAAHPYHITTSFNYDLEKGHEISLDQLI